MVNDSVYGPLYDISTYLHSMESLGAPAFSLVLNPHRRHPHLQSWFIGLTPEVFASKWFSDFILSVRKEDCKEDICVKYETGLTELVASRGLVYDALYKVPGKKIYNSVKSLYIKGLPFVKKAAFVRHNGSLGAQLSYIFQRLDPQCREAILSDAERIYGKEYTERLLTGNPFCIAFRYLAYLISKLYSRRIWQSFFQVFV